MVASLADPRNTATGKLPGEGAAPSAGSDDSAVRRVEAILEPLPMTERQHVIEQTMFHQGPLPPAELLRQYDGVVPGLAREIADGAVEERRFRHDMTRRTGTQEFILNMAGLGAMLIALMLMLAIVAYMVSSGAPYAGAGLGGAIIVGVIVALSNYRKAESTRLAQHAPSTEDEAAA